MDEQKDKPLGDALKEGARIAGEFVLTVGALLVDLAKVIDNHDSQDCDCDECRKGRRG